MPGITLYEASIRNFLRGTTSLRNILQKASTHPDSSIFPDARLIDDMHPLTFQIRIALNMAEKAAIYLGDTNSTLSEGKESTLPDMIDRCEKVIQMLQNIDANVVEGKADESLAVQLGDMPRPFKMTGRDFVFAQAIPNFFFHLNTAYAILRMKGVPLGKMDYLGPFMDGVAMAKM